MRLIFGGTIVVILLGLYVYAVIFAILVALGRVAGPLNSGFATTMTTIGGLVSALVIAELAITKPGEAPMARALASDTGQMRGPSAARILTLFSVIYVAVWIILGLTAYVVGVLQFPGEVTTLTDLGQSWLGLAVAASYAYFGIDRTG